MGEFEGKVVVVTGAAGALGRAPWSITSPALAGCDRAYSMSSKLDNTHLERSPCDLTDAKRLPVRQR